MASRLNIVSNFGINFNETESSNRMTVMVNQMTVMVNQRDSFKYLNIKALAKTLVQLAWL